MKPEQSAPQAAAGSRSELVRTMLGVLFVAGMIAASLLILYPFLSALIWAMLLVVSTWRLMIAVQARLWGKRALAVIVMTILQLLVVIVPLALAVATLFSNADQLVARLEALKVWSVPSPPDWAWEVPVVGARLAQRWQELASMRPDELRARVEPYSRSATRWVLLKAGSLAVFFLHLALTVVIAAALYFKGEDAANGVRA